VAKIAAHRAASVVTRSFGPSLLSLSYMENIKLIAS
jgi:hypothetical protein